MQLLLRHGIPVGAVLAEADNFDMAVSSAIKGSVPADRLDRSQVVDAVRDRWSGSFVVTDSQRDLNIVSPRSSHCQAALQRTVREGVFSGTPVEILFALSKSFDRSLEGLPPPGMVHGGGTDDEASEATDVLQEELIVSVSGSTLRAALNELVAESGSLGWFVWERCEPTARCLCQMGLLTPTSMLYAGYDAAAGLGSR